MDEVLQLTIAIFLGMVACFYIWRMYMLKKKLLAKMGGKYIVIRMPKYYTWVGMVCTGVFLYLSLDVVIHPDLYATGSTVVEGFILMSPFLILSLVVLAGGVAWRIYIVKELDYFIYTTLWGRSYKIFYNQIPYYELGLQVFIIKAYGKKFYIQLYAENLKVMQKMFSKHKIRMHSDGTKKSKVMEYIFKKLL